MTTLPFPSKHHSHNKLAFSALETASRIRVRSRDKADKVNQFVVDAANQLVNHIAEYRFIIPSFGREGEWEHQQEARRGIDASIALLWDLGFRVRWTRDLEDGAVIFYLVRRSKRATRRRGRTENVR